MLLAAALMGDKMSSLNWLGFTVCLSGISLHVGIKTYYSKSKFFFFLLCSVVYKVAKSTGFPLAGFKCICFVLKKMHA